ncbi:unnamed protein product [Candida verbasci]|uniref:Uncharacterized protein n=1 Tax=Candida verbasci TaxID=1227364 RepID=A0A9W4TSW6_9ASCO|nr:unnamed protein product [Candida verbasci]
MHLSKSISRLQINNKDRNDTSGSPPDYQFIKNLNYEELESKFQIYKYYPLYIHNYDISTPVLKDLICDKPIYNDANKHVKKEKLKKKKQNLKETRQLRKDQREERKQLRLDQREERKDLRREAKEQRESYTGHFMKRADKLNEIAKNGNNLNEIRQCSGNTNPYHINNNNNNNINNKDADFSHIEDTTFERDSNSSQDSEATEVDDEVNSQLLSFKNPFDKGKKLTINQYIDNNNYNLSNYSYSQPSSMSRNNSINIFSTNNSMVMTQSNSNNTVNTNPNTNSNPNPNTNRRSSSTSTTLFNNSQNSSMKRSNSIASKFMNMFNNYEHDNSSQDSINSTREKRNSTVQVNQPPPSYKIKHKASMLDESYPIEKSLSFDQSKSTKTLLKNKLKLKLGNELNRRYSDQIGMY